MIDFFENGVAFWGGGAAWFVTGILLLLGFLGTIIPFLPGHLLVLLAAVAHRLMLGDESGVEWWTFVVLGLLLVVSQLLEFLSGAMGARWFGGSKWGALGSLLGGVIGLFFMPFGLLLGPLVGAVFFEYYVAKQGVKPATVSGVGSVLGTVAGMLIKMVVGIMMIVWFLVDVFWI